MQIVGAILFVSSGCDGIVEGPAGEGGDPPDPGESAEWAPGSPDSSDSGAEPDGEDDEYGCADLYAQSLLPAFELDIEPGDLAALQADYRTGEKEYHPATFHYGDEAADVWVRLKGNPGFSWFGGKLQYVISFNEDDPEARFHGLRKLSLDATWYEPTLLRDRLAWTIMRERGELPAACANNATLSINGEFAGTYANIEYFDHEYLERAFGKEAATGTLWKYGTEPTANAENADEAKLQSFWRSDDVATLEALGDVRQWTREWAAEAVLGDDDGYWCCAHNFYLYDHPTDGLLFVPWDFDDTFEITPYDSDPVEGYGRGLFDQDHFLAVVADPAWRAVYVEEVEAMNAMMNPVSSLVRLAEWEAQIRPDLERDPYRTFSMEEHDAQLARLAAFLPARHAFVDAWVACQRDPTQDADGDGRTACDDNDEGTPVSAESCNGVDDDANGLVDDLAACEDCERHDIDERHLAYCSWPRSYDDAQANCEEEGGTLAVPADTEEVYMTFFYTWSRYEPWWLGRDDGATCLTWDVASFSYGSEPCADEHPSVCRLP